MATHQSQTIEHAETVVHSDWWKQSSWFSKPSEALCVEGIEVDDATREVPCTTQAIHKRQQIV
jgi:hypothetical protein